MRRVKATLGASGIGKGKKRQAEGISDGSSNFRRCFAWHCYFIKIQQQRLVKVQSDQKLRQVIFLNSVFFSE